MPRHFVLVLPALFLPFAAAPALQPKDKKLTLQATAEMKYTVQGHAHRVAISPDGKLVAVGTEDVSLHDVSGKEPKKVGLFNSTVGFGITALTFTPDGKHLVFGGRDWTVRVWSVEGMRETARVKEHRSDVRAVAVTPDSKMVASGSQDRTAILWDLSDDGALKEQHVIRAEDKFGDAVVGLAFVSKGKGLYTINSNCTFRGYTLGKGAPKVTSGFKPPRGGVNSQCIVPNAAGTLFAIADDASAFLVGPTGTAYGSLVGHKESVTGLSFAPDGKLVASCGRDGSVIVWDVGTRAAKYTKVRPGTFSGVAFSPYINAVTSEYTVAACQDDGTVHVMRLAYR